VKSNNKTPIKKDYSPNEEKINVVTHGVGFLLSIPAMVMLITRSASQEILRNTISAGVFGISLVLLYAVSTLYHYSKAPKTREKLHILDHACIYVLIAGTYTPFTLITLHSPLGWGLFITSWTMALIGISLKLFFTGRYKLLSTIMYVVMGWVIIIAIKPLYNNLPPGGIVWLFAGGIFYTLGAVLYSIKRIKFNHAIFHILVLGGSASHFISVYFYILK
jgi:hemolysin III